VTILHHWQASNGWSFTAHNTLESGTSMGTLCESYISTTQVSVKIHRIHNAWTNWNWLLLLLLGGKQGRVNGGIN